MAQAFGFVPPPAGIVAALVAITLLYTAANEIAKRWFLARAPREQAF